MSFVATAWSVPSVSDLVLNLALVGAYAGWRRLRTRLGPALVGVSLALTAVGVTQVQANPHAVWVGERQVSGELVAEVVGGPAPLPGGRYRIELDLKAWDGTPVDVRASVVSEHRVLPGDVIRCWARLARPPDAAFPGDVGARSALSRRGISLSGSLREVPEVLERRWAWSRRLARARLKHVDGLLSRLDSDRAALAIALTTGNKSFISDEDSEVWNVSGTGHLLAVSGLHFGFVAAILWTVGRWLAGWFPMVVRRVGAKRFAAPFVGVALLLVLIWVGGPTSARRAFVLGICAAAALGALRPVTPSRLLCAAAVAIGAVDPAVVRELGYQLSFAATAAIVVLLEGPLARRPEAESASLREKAWSFVALSTGASAATAPFLGAHLGAVPVGGFWANLWAIPVVGSVAFPLIVLGSLIAPIWPDLGYLIVSSGALVIQGLHETIEWSAGPETLWVTGRWPMWVAVAGAAAVFGMCGRNQAVARVSALIALVLMVGLEVRHAPPDAIEIHAIPVGQGDATLVRFPNGEVALIDAGGSTHGRDPGSRIVVPYLRRVGVREVHRLVVTHPDHDHIGGLAAVIRGVPVHDVIRDGCHRDEEVIGAFGGAALRHVELCGATSWRGADWRVTAIRPELHSDSRNDRSIVLEIDRGPARALLTGDAEHVAEAWWLEHRARRATLLKLGHHGSTTSSGDAFLSATRPTLAFASAGRFSRFGHPAPEVVERVEAQGTAVASTARDGLIIYEMLGTGEMRWRSIRAPPLANQASTSRMTRSMAKSSRSGETSLIPKGSSTDSTNL